MDSSRLPVVKLTEQSLRRIKEKLEKLRVDDKAEGKFNELHTVRQFANFVTFLLVSGKNLIYCIPSTRFILNYFGVVFCEIRFLVKCVINPKKQNNVKQTKMI